MKKHELLKYAYDNYKDGTVVKWGGGEITLNGVYQFNDEGRILDGNSKCVYDPKDSRMNWATIVLATFECADCEREKDLSLRTDGQPNVCTDCTNSYKKNSILSGKCAIQVNNEREFKLLMEHMHSKGWTWNGGEDPISLYIPNRKYPFAIWYENEFLWDDVELSKDRLLIPFSDFASEVGITVPVFVMTSEDGVPLYEGDTYYRVYHYDATNFPKWVQDECSPLAKNHAVVDGHSQSKAFSTKEAAEKWCKEQNKPKHIVITHTGGDITVSKAAITFNTPEKCFSGSYFQKIIEAYKSLQ